MTDRDRLKENIQLLNKHNQSNRPIYKISNGRKYEFDVINEIVKDVSLILDKIEKGTLIELPCKVGDTVYCIEHNTIHECVVKTVKSLTYESQTIFFVEVECEIVDPFYSDGRKLKHGIYAVWEIEWGSHYRAFPTKEEAEAKLKECEG